MSIFKKARKALGRAVRASGRIAKQGLARDSKMMSGPFGGAMNFGGGEKEESDDEGPVPDDLGQRAAAAKRLAETQRQAGGGQIKFNTMTEEPQ